MSVEGSINNDDDDDDWSVHDTDDETEEICCSSCKEAFSSSASGISLLKKLCASCFGQFKAAAKADFKGTNADQKESIGNCDIITEIEEEGSGREKNDAEDAEDSTKTNSPLATDNQESDQTDGRIELVPTNVGKKK